MLLAIVKITSYGKVFSEKLIEELAPLNPVIGSGFAYGVDIMLIKQLLKMVYKWLLV